MLDSLTMLATSGGYWFPEQGSTVAPAADFVFHLILWISVVFFVLICGASIFFVFKYRRREGQEVQESVHHNTKLEILWTAIPSILAFAIFLISAGVYLDMQDMPEGDDVEEIHVVAQKWSWQFRYMNGEKLSFNEIHVPAGRPVVVTMESRDVLHSFYIPAFRVKQDVVPGRYAKLWFEPETFEGDEPKKYRLYCTEYCGTGHSDMVGWVIVHKDYASYKNAVMNMKAPPAGTAARGEYVFNVAGCAACHSTEEGKVAIGPSFYGLWGREEETDQGTVTVDENYLRESIRNPAAKLVDGFPNQMTAYPDKALEKGGLTEDDISGLIAWLKTEQMGGK